MDLNQGPKDYESSALTAELMARKTSHHSMFSRLVQSVRGYNSAFALRMHLVISAHSRSFKSFSSTPSTCAYSVAGTESSSNSNVYGISKHRAISSSVSIETPRVPCSICVINAVEMSIFSASSACDHFRSSRYFRTFRPKTFRIPSIPNDKIKL